ncbi:MAG: acyl-CoA desaturase [Bacteroidales bacterium]|jgi:linoleoyl-CoA desaturase|nr:acyl-CoA desaturase [Bacteroidales bacterium]NCU35525.1 acyl-CoA desaturase [Candidatus Falkowbacteria bacterium]MDD3527227.1 acyl-CoA desaturase [Bacteroidales bacterium]MDD4177318.1 acyl-CoA desaturase [Bacteroidales bacterium]MDD4741246.1 acyl-CoA desaturase [Bacteroidales bacterium]
MQEKKLKFSTKDTPEFIKELRASVRTYFAEHNISRYGNRSLFIKSIAMLALYIIPFVLMMTGVVTAFPLLLAMWVLMGIGMAGIGMGLMHDANHGTFSENPRINRWVSKSIYLLGGFPPNWRYQHNTMHHGFTNIEGHDEDIRPVGILRFSPHRPLYGIHRFQQWYAWFFYGLMTISWATTKDFRQLIGYHRQDVLPGGKESFPRLLTDLIIAKIIYFAVLIVLPIILLPVAWYWIVVFFLVMHFVAGFILGVVFQTAHVVPSSAYPLADEQGNLENSWAISQLMTTADFAPGNKLISWYTGGLNYQIEHHLFPNISHVHYPQLAPIVQAAAAKYNLPYHQQGSFGQALHNHYQMLRQLGRGSVLQQDSVTGIEGEPAMA